MKQTTFALAAALFAVTSALADAPQIDRTIGKEPVYQTKSPKYCLLTFGPEGKDRAWLVFDGDTLYVDRNGDGDLTEPGKKVAAERRQNGDPEFDGFNFAVGDLIVGGRTHKSLLVSFRPIDWYTPTLGNRSDFKALVAKDPKQMVATIRIYVDMPGLKGAGVGGRAGFIVSTYDLSGIFQFADKPADAPVVRLGGPVEITFYRGLPTLRAGRESELFLIAGIRGIGPGAFAILDYEDSIPESAKPTVELILPPAKVGDPPIKERWEIKERC